MSSTGYDPKTIEPGILKMWDEGGYFHADADPSRVPFVITIPPPNVTGALHLGHALNNTLQDVLIRRKRMQGFNACWLPGTDHAGIATQAVVEKRLREEQGWVRDKSNPEHRPFLVGKIWEWKQDYNARILNQLKRMGCSCDWRRTRFTLDEGCVQAVYETFFKLFRDGLIYRGKRLVNWDTQLQTAVADDEVYHETVRGSLWHIRYPVAEEGLRDQGIKGSREDARVDSSLDPLIPRSLDPSEYLIVATTRPETMLADTAVAVHPDDARFQHLIGKRVVLPLSGRTIPVIADGILVKREFGTGCVKVTPAHDPNDYACWQRKLNQPDAIEIRNMMTADGRVHADNAGEGNKYAGLKLDEARKRIVADLEAAGLLEKIEPYETEVGHSDRSKTQIQPYLSEQWFVKMDTLAETAMEAVRDGRVQFFPERYAKSYLDWLGEKRDWCISRQLWWGHRIPVWHIDLMYEANAAEFLDLLNELLCVSNVAGEFSLRGEVQTSRYALCAHSSRARELMTYIEGLRLHSVAGFATPPPCPNWLTNHPAISTLKSRFERLARFIEQDPDVLDTWFSSQLWPHSTFGWPNGVTSESVQNPKSKIQNGTRDLDYFYPTSVLSTARDIISLWVARMVMSGLYNLGRVPFQHVLIHPTIQDGKGQRMSKSAGNGVDPLDLIELYGTDAMRFTLAGLAGETQDCRIPVKPVQTPDGRMVNSSERFEWGRNFCNKVWQASTGFVLPQLEGSKDQGNKGSREETESASSLDSSLAIEDRWILSRLHATIDEVDRALDRYQFSDAVSTLYNFFWSDFCDWYVEFAKPRLGQRHADGSTTRREDESAHTSRRVLAWVLDQSLRLLHPFMPFVTEAVWAELGRAVPKRTGFGPQKGSRDQGTKGSRENSARESSLDPSIPRSLDPSPLIAATWPSLTDSPADAEAEREIEPAREVIRALRDIRTHINAMRSAEKQPALRSLPHAAVRCDAAMSARLNHNAAQIHRLGSVEGLAISPDVPRPPDAVSKVLAGGVQVFVQITGLCDIEIERKRLRKERDELTAHVGRIEANLSNEAFVAKAPPAKVEAERARLEEARGKLEAVQRNLAEVGG